MKLSIATFVTPHGFGHAARACAVMEAIARFAGPEARFDIFTRVPRWFFERSLGDGFEVHDVPTDVGLAQLGPLREDLDETVRRLDAFLPLDDGLVDSLADDLRRRGCVAVLCDIAPLGIAAASRAGIPSVLIENFTWDWIYGGYDEPRLAPHARTLRQLFAAADHRIQCEPLCDRAPALARVAPVSRAPRTGRSEVRAQLGIGADDPMVVVSMGGVPGEYPWLDALARRADATYVVPGVGDEIRREGGVLTLPQDSPLYHPDLVAASDAVVAKLGYSTVAEVFRAGVPLAHVGRARFREVGPLADFAAREIGGFGLQPEAFASGAWLDRVGELLALGRRDRPGPDGAEQVATVILEEVLGMNRNEPQVLDRPYDEIQVGDRATFTRTVTAARVDAFAEVSGDYNPVHVDPAFAATTPFGERIAHGMYAASLVSTVIGTRLPGVNAVYLGQEMRFTAPTRIGDTLTAECEVIEKRSDKPILRLRTTVTRQDGVAVLEGEAVVKKDAPRA